MFRAIAVALFEKYAQSPDALASLVQRVGVAPQAGFHPFPEDCLQSINKSIDELSHGKSIQEIQCDKEMSTNWVVFLRRLAANYILSPDPENRDVFLSLMANEVKSNKWSELQGKLAQINKDLNSNNPEVFDAATKALEPTQTAIDKERNEIITQYLLSKIDMSEKDPEKTYGTNLELIALSTVLKTTIGVINFDSIKDNPILGGIIFPKQERFKGNIPPNIDLFLIFRGSHYNTLFKK
jgi:hypothetical protein